MAVKIEKKIKGYSVLSPEDKAAQQAAASATNTHFTDESDRRLKLVGTPVPPTASLRWQKRPVLAEGNPSHTYMVDSPEGRFAVIVGHVPNGTPTTGSPFEVWVVGEAPRGLPPLARSLSIDMRSQDRAWLAKKLDALSKCAGEAFEMDMPDGRRVRAPSAVAAFAMLVKFRCEQLGAFTDEKMAETPVVNALMSPREPKTTADGALSWYVDVNNQATGDDFVLMLKEATLEDGSRRPFSLFLSGHYPRSLDGLAKSLSLDMRIAEPGWMARKLQQLEDVHEERGEFWAPIPGNADGKQQCYPSTVAYVAALIQHRFRTLGLFDESNAAKDSGVINFDEARQQREAAKSDKSKASAGIDCGKCKTVGSMILMDGCMTCTTCGDSKCG